jgi:hypothetical protein
MPENPVTGRPAAPVESVFGGERQTPHAVFEKSRIENAGASPMHRPNDLAMACPKCAAQGIPDSRMFAQVNQGYYCMRGHKWTDYDELMSMNPAKLPFKGFKAKQDNYRKVELEMPESTVAALQAKFKDNLAETLAAFMDVIAQSRFMLVNEESLVKLEQLTGMPIKNGNNLVVVVYALKEKEREQSDAIEKLEARTAGPGKASPDTVTLDLPNVMEKIRTKLGPNETVEDFLTNAVTTFVQNDWI